MARAETAGSHLMSDTCKYKQFPVSSGGSKDEKVSCTVYDKTNDFIIVAGNSTSEDYAPAANNHAFAYALDLDGNWERSEERRGGEEGWGTWGRRRGVGRVKRKVSSTRAGTSNTRQEKRHSECATNIQRLRPD